MTGKITICTERLIIRPFRDDDIMGFFHLFSRPQVRCFEEDKTENIEQARDALQRQKNMDDGSSMAVCLKDGGVFIGTIFGIWEGDTFSVCWNFDAEYQGHGYAYEAAEAYFGFLFERMNARRIYAYVEDYNISSQNLCKKLGMRQEGFFIEFISFVRDSDGTPIYENTMQFAILKKEWEKKGKSV